MARKPRPDPVPPPVVEPEEPDDERVPDPIDDDEIPDAEVEGSVELPAPAESASAGPDLNMGPPGAMPRQPEFHNHIPMFAGMPQSSQSPLPPWAQQPEPSRDDGGDEYPDQPRRDGDPAREAKAASGGRETDLLVNVFVDYEDEEHGGEMVSCGMLSRITMTRAYMPETYIPTWVGGNTFWVRVYYATGNPNSVGRPLGNGSAIKYPANTGKPFVRGWKVDMDIDQMIAQKLAAAGIVVPGGAVAGQAPGTIPIGYAQGQVGYYQQQIEDLKRRTDAAEERARRAEEEQRLQNIIKPLQDTVQRLEAKLNDGGSSKRDDALVEVVKAAMANQGQRQGGFSEALEIVKMTQGPEAMSAMATVNQMVVQNLVSMVKTAKGDSDKFDIGKMMEAYEKFNNAQVKQKKEEREWIDQKRREQEERDEKRKHESDEIKSKERVQISAIQRSTDAMMLDIRNAMDRREAPNNVGAKVNVMWASVHAFDWSKTDKSTKEMIEELRDDPEKVFSRFATAAGFGVKRPMTDEDARYIGMCAAFFREFAGLGQRGQPKEEPRQEEPQTQQPQPDTTRAQAGTADTTAPASGAEEKPSGTSQTAPTNTETGPSPAPERQPTETPAMKS